MVLIPKRCLKCRFRSGQFAPGYNCGCEYSALNGGKTRLAQVYKRLGVRTLTKEAAELMRGENCPFFESGELPRRRPQISTRTWDTQKARALLERGATDREIAAAVGTSQTAVASWRQSVGLPGNPMKKPRIPREDAARIEAEEALRRLHAQGLNDREIGAALKMPPQSVAYLRTRLELPANFPKKHIDGERLRTLAEAGYNDGEIAAALGVNRKNVQRFRERNGIGNLAERQAARVRALIDAGHSPGGGEYATDQMAVRAKEAG